MFGLFADPLKPKIEAHFHSVADSLASEVYELRDELGRQQGNIRLRLNFRGREPFYLSCWIFNSAVHSSGYPKAQIERGRSALGYAMQRYARPIAVAANPGRPPSSPEVEETLQSILATVNRVIDEYNQCFANDQRRAFNYEIAENEIAFNMAEHFIFRTLEEDSLRAILRQRRPEIMQMISKYMGYTLSLLRK